MYFVIVNPHFGKTKPEPFTDYGRAMARFKNYCERTWATVVHLVVDTVNGERVSRPVLKREGGKWDLVASRNRITGGRHG